MMSGHRSNRCSHCDVNWPAFSTYLICPTCKTETWVAPSETPLTSSAAVDLVKEHEVRTAAEALIQRDLEGLDEEWERFVV